MMASVLQGHGYAPRAGKGAGGCLGCVGCWCVFTNHTGCSGVLLPCIQAMPVGDRAIPTRRTHFTVISGPHVHKTAREQFARTTHTRVIQVGTNNLSELNWLLESIKMYK